MCFADILYLSISLSIGLTTYIHKYIYIYLSLSLSLSFVQAMEKSLSSYICIYIYIYLSLSLFFVERPLSLIHTCAPKHKCRHGAWTCTRTYTYACPYLPFDRSLFLCPPSTQAHTPKYACMHACTRPSVQSLHLYIHLSSVDLSVLSL